MRPIEKASKPEKAPQSPRRRWVRWALFALLPFALAAGAYWYVTGGQVMSTDDAYVQAETVGISTDVSGIVQGIDVANNQRVDPGQLGLQRIEAASPQLARDLRLAAVARTASIDLHEIAIGIFALRVFVQILHIRVRRSAIDIEVIFFDVFAVIGLAVR